MENAGRVILWWVTALLGLLVGVASATEVGEALEREREYRASPVCSSVPVTASACVWEQPFSVREAKADGVGRGERLAATLLPPSGEPWEVVFRNTGPVLSRMQPGDAVVGVVWRGGVVEVRDADGRRQQTEFGPSEWPADRLGGALAFIPFGLIALAGSVWPIVKRGDRRHERAATAVRWHGVALGATGLLTLWVQADNGWPLWAIWAIWGPVALVLLATMAACVVAALRGTAEGGGPAAGPPARREPAAPRQPAVEGRVAPAGEERVAPARERLPREYRMSRSRRIELTALLVAKTAVLVLAVWSEDLPPRWFQVGLSVLMPLLALVGIVRMPRCGTFVDNTGIHIRGMFRTRRVAWEDVQEIRSEPLRGSDGGLAPRTLVHVYLADGSRRLLQHLDDKGYDVDREVAVLDVARAARRRRGGAAADVPVS
ncbi:PH domain-containing protein [Streptomyces erythrochromogenes]|uniref:PH domain-containing protein n=1 Tax=Streptomyces erythrochromogenes TaxID=285574 RepID=UPI003691F912